MANCTKMQKVSWQAMRLARNGRIERITWSKGTKRTEWGNEIDLRKREDRRTDTIVIIPISPFYTICSKHTYGDAWVDDFGASSMPRWTGS